MANVNQMDELVSVSTGPRRFSMVLLSVFSMLAVVLAAIGLYGVMAYSVTQRTKELGVRLALGATPRGVQQLVMGQGMRLAVAGVGFGLVAAFVLTNLLRALDGQTAVGASDRLLFDVSAHDPLTFVGIPLLLLCRHARRQLGAGATRHHAQSGRGPPRGVSRSRSPPWEICVSRSAIS